MKEDARSFVKRNWSAIDRVAAALMESFGPPGFPLQPAEAWYCGTHRHEGERAWAARYRGGSADGDAQRAAGVLHAKRNGPGRSAPTFD
jgi:hypothetical protein